MTRKMEVTLPSEVTDGLVKDIKKLEGLVGLSVQRDASLLSPGDILSITVTDTGSHDLMRMLDEKGLTTREGVSIITSEPTGVIQSKQAEKLTLDKSEAIWEEMEKVIGKESNITANTLIMMAAAGVFAAAGIATNALHIVIAGMVIAPGFGPLVRIALGLVTDSRAWQRGIIHMLQGYAAMASGAAVIALLMAASGRDPLVGEATYLPEGVLLNYFTTINFPAVLISLTAGILGAVLLSTNRSVLTLGVMIALALVPSASLVGMALVTGRMDIAGQSALRWGIDAVLVIAASLAVLAVKQRLVQRRKMVL